MATQQDIDAIDWSQFTGYEASLPQKAAAQPDPTQIMPIGKYRGQPVEVLANDRSYCEWLTAQSWFRDQHPNLYAVIINNFAQSNETPEHNQMQVRFLDETWRKKLVVTLLPRTAFMPDGFLNKVQHFEANCHRLVPNEHGGLNLWSLRKDDHGVEPYWIEGTKSFSGPIRQVRVLSSWPVHEFMVGDPNFENNGTDVVYRAWSDELEDWPFSNVSLNILLNIEIKPQVGDDFPAILRQIKRQRINARTVPHTNSRGCTSYVREEYQEPGWWILLIRRYEGSVSYEDMRAFMRASKVIVVCENDIEATPLPAAASVSAAQVAAAMRLSICQQTDLRQVEDYRRDHEAWWSQHRQLMQVVDDANPICQGQPYSAWEYTNRSLLEALHPCTQDREDLDRLITAIRRTNFALYHDERHYLRGAEEVIRNDITLQKGKKDE